MKYPMFHPIAYALAAIIHVAAALVIAMILVVAAAYLVGALAGIT